MNALVRFPAAFEPSRAHARRVVLYGRRELMLEGLRHALASVADLDVVATRALDASARLAPEVELAILDASGLGARAGAVVADLRRVLGPAARMLVLVEEGREAQAPSLARLGVDGLAPADTPAAELADLVNDVLAGRVAIAPRLHAALLEEARASALGFELSPRERDLLKLAAQGRRNKEIASRLGITEGTVKSYLRRLMDRLGARDRTHAVVIAMSRALIEPA